MRFSTVSSELTSLASHPKSTKHHAKTELPRRTNRRGSAIFRTEQGPRTRRARTTSLEFDRLDERVVLSSLSHSIMASSASTEIARIDAKKSKPPNLTPWASLATEVFKKARSDLRLIGGGAFSASEKKATVQALEVGFCNSGASKVASGTLALTTFYNFDDGAGTLLFQLPTDRPQDRLRGAD
jgi:hypothetical protein